MSLDLAAPSVAASVFDRRRRALTLGLVLTVTLVGFEALAVSTALPQIQQELRGLALYGWVSAAYLLGQLIGIPAAGLLADRRGLALPFGAGLTLFAAGLAIAGAAPAMVVLVLARLLQGIGGGAIPAIAYVAAGRAYPPELRPRVFAIMSSAWVLPGLIGPSISAAVTIQLGWRWVFFGLLPLIPLAAAMTLPSLRRLSAGADAATARCRPACAARSLLAAGVALLLASRRPAARPRDRRRRIGSAARAAQLCRAGAARHPSPEAGPAGDDRDARFPDLFVLRGRLLRALRLPRRARHQSHRRRALGHGGDLLVDRGCVDLGASAAAGRPARAGAARSVLDRGRQRADRGGAVARHRELGRWVAGVGARRDSASGSAIPSSR